MEVFDRNKILEVAKAAVDRTPDALNPTNEETGCLNTGEDGSHCIAAQVLVDLGLKDALTFVKNGASIDETILEADITERFTNEALCTLGYLQQDFDHCSHKNIPWDEAWKLFRAEDAEREYGLGSV